MDQLFRLNGYDLFGFAISGLAGLLAIDLVFGTAFVLEANWAAADAVLIVLAAYVLGHIVAMAASALIERLVTDGLLGHPIHHMLSDDDKAIRTTLGSIFGDYFAPLPSVHRKALQRLYDGSCEGLFQQAFALARRDEHSASRLESFLVLYGFSRNLAFVCLCTALAIGAQLLFHQTSPCMVARTLPCPAVSIGALILGLALFLRYLKYRRHYVKEVVLSYLSLQNPKETRG